jgi:hypothetical protein
MLSVFVLGSRLYIAFVLLVLVTSFCLTVVILGTWRSL